MMKLKNYKINSNHLLQMIRHLKKLMIPYSTQTPQLKTQTKPKAMTFSPRSSRQQKSRIISLLKIKMMTCFRRLWCLLRRRMLCLMSRTMHLRTNQNLPATISSKTTNSLSMVCSLMMLIRMMIFEYKRIKRII